MTPHDEPARDAWLSQALLHAPDAHAAPPADLSEAILSQARNALKSPAAAPARANPLLQLWSWLARPPVAAGFATLTVATLVGVMWRDPPLDASLPRPQAPAATAPSTFTPLPSSPAAPPSAQDETKTVARVAPEPSLRNAAAPPPAAKRERAVASHAPAATGGLRERAVDAVPPPAGAAPEHAPTPAPAPAPMAADAAKPPVAQAHQEDAERRSTTTPAQALVKAATAAAPATTLSLRRQDNDTLTPVIDQPEHWTWQRGAGTQAMTPALQRWLAQLDRVARWRPASSAAPSAADGSVLQLWRDRALRATIALVDDAVWLTPADGAPVMAPLAPATAASLKAALVAAAP